MPVFLSKVEVNRKNGTFKCELLKNMDLNLENVDL